MSGPIRTTAHTSSVLTGTKVGFLGPGSIGGPIVRRLVASGADVAVLARSAEVRSDLERAGATATTSVGETMRGCDTVVCCLYSDAQLHAISDELVDAIDPGAILVSHTTGSPTTLRALAERLPRGDRRVVDAPFSGTADDVATGHLTVMLGGTPAARASAEKVVRCYASTVIPTGGLGSALLVKLVNNVVFAANAQIALEVARLGAALDLPEEILLDAVQSSSGATRAIDHMAHFPDAATFADTIRPYLVKDVAVGREVARDVGVDLGLLDLVVDGGSISMTEQHVRRRS